ncbi:MAG: hypothetical protein C9356_19875, partial [Oleiphilus sp.]
KIPSVHMLVLLAKLYLAICAAFGDKIPSVHMLVLLAKLYLAICIASGRKEHQDDVICFAVLAAMD